MYIHNLLRSFQLNLIFSFDSDPDPDPRCGVSVYRAQSKSNKLYIELDRGGGRVWSTILRQLNTADQTAGQKVTPVQPYSCPEI